MAPSSARPATRSGGWPHAPVGPPHRRCRTDGGEALRASGPRWRTGHRGSRPCPGGPGSGCAPRSSGRPLVELGQALGHTGGGALFEEPLLHVPEGALHLALPLGVPGLAGPDLGAVELGELGCRRMEGEPSALGGAERPHPIGAQDLGDPADPLEEPDQALEGVLPVDGPGEPPDPHPRPGQDRLEALDVAQSPPPRPVGDIGPVELALLARCRHDPGGGGRGGGEPRPPQVEKVPGHARIGAGIALGGNQLEHAGGEQPRGSSHQLGDPGRPAPRRSPAGWDWCAGPEALRSSASC